MPWDRMNPTTAVEWEEFNMFPAGNRNSAEGRKYFDIHSFHFLEDIDYSQFAAGFEPSFSEGHTMWLELLSRWERESAPSFDNWRRREDMHVIANSRRQEKGGGFPGYKEGPVNDDIIRSCITISIGRYVYTSEFSKSDGISKMVSEEALKQTRVRVQCVALSRDINVSILHNTVFSEGRHIPTQRAKLVVWVESDLSRDELSWRWFGSVYSWRHGRMEPVSNCDDASRDIVNGMTLPLVREWTQLVKEVIQKQTNRQASKDRRPNSPVTDPGRGGQKTDPPTKPFTFDTDLSATTVPLASTPGWIKKSHFVPPLFATGGEPSKLIFQLDAPVITDTVVKISSDQPLVAMPEHSEVIIPAGDQEGSVKIRTFRVMSEPKTCVDFTVTVNGKSRNAMLFVLNQINPTPTNSESTGIDFSFGRNSIKQPSASPPPMKVQESSQQYVAMRGELYSPASQVSSLAGIGIWVHRDGFTKEEISSASVVGGRLGDKVSYFVWLTAPTTLTQGDVVVEVKSDRPDVADVDGDSRVVFKLLKGRYSAYYSIKTNHVFSDTPVTFTATCNGISKTVTLIVKGVNFGRSGSR